MYIEDNFSMVLDRKKCICEINFKMHWSYYKMCQLLQNVTFFKKCIGTANDYCFNVVLV